MRVPGRAPTLACMVLLCAAMQLALAAPSIEEREARLAASLRCLVCQNQTLAESNAPLAADMRREIREQLGAGRSDEQVRSFFEQRYGAFVRYDPPFAPATWLLWIGPFALLVAGLVALWRVVKRRTGLAAPPLTPAERTRAEQLAQGDAP